MNQIRTKKVNSKQIFVTRENAGQRIDNFLIRHFGKIPKSRIYQMLRKGEVRINSGRIKQTYKLAEGDILRVPPVYLDERGESTSTPTRALQEKIINSILFEDEGLIIINKPPGIVVHSGSDQAYGVIEVFRSLGGRYAKLELAHRLDKDTSGCLILAKSIPVLRQLHTSMNSGAVAKSYCALLAGRITKKEITVKAALRKNTARAGERVVTVDKNGRSATTIFAHERIFKTATLADIKLLTGRTHQIRVHSATIGHPVIGDLKYGDRTINREYRKLGLRRMFLHAKTLRFQSPVNQQQLLVNAPLEQNLINFLALLSDSAI